MSTLPPAPGDPDALDHAIESLAVTAQALLHAAQAMSAAAVEGSGKALDSTRERSAGTATRLGQGGDRYAGAVAGLREYSVVLRDAHRITARAAQDHDRATAHAHTFSERAHHAAAQLAMIAPIPTSTLTIAHLQDELQSARQGERAAMEAAHQAQLLYDNAMAQLDDAAHRAAAIVRAACDASNDAARGIFDTLADAAAWAWDTIEHLARDVLAAVITSIECAVKALIMGLGLLLVSVVVALVVGIVAIAAVLVAAFALQMTLAQIIRHVVTTAIDRELDFWGIEGVERVRMAFVLLTIVAPPLGAVLSLRMAEEALKPTPEVTRMQEEVAAEHPQAMEDLQQKPDDLADLLEWSGDVDSLGGSEAAVVDIAKVVAADGTVSWIVTLPSTQDWCIPGDKGAPNDLDACLLLMLMPQLKSQYERAVLEAMKQAGIAPDEPVLMVGWSLGGILAGKMASQDSGGYNYQGVLAGGSPIDGFDVDAPVLQVKHQDDGIHELDFVDAQGSHGDHLELWDGVWSGTTFSSIKTGNLIGHECQDYANTLRSHLDHDPAINDLFDDVLPWEGGEGDFSIEHRQYSFHE